MSKYISNNPVNLPLELEAIIISFLKGSTASLVCSDWNIEWNHINKKKLAVFKISRWYYKNMHIEGTAYMTLGNLFSSYSRYYPTVYLLKYPEFSLRKMGMSARLLEGLPPVKERTRGDIIRWMMRQKFTLDDWLLVGW